MIGFKRKKPARGFLWRTVRKGGDRRLLLRLYICLPFILFLRRTAPQTSARRRHRGQGLLPPRAAGRYLPAMLARAFSFPRGLDFALHSPQFLSPATPFLADRFCGFPHFRDTVRAAIILGRFAICFPGKIDFRGKLLSVPLLGEQFREIDSKSAHFAIRSGTANIKIR